MSGSKLCTLYTSVRLWHQVDVSCSQTVGCRVDRILFFHWIDEKNVASYVMVMSPYAHSFHVTIYTFIHFPLSVSFSSYERQFVVSSVRLEKYFLYVNVSRRTRRDSLGYGIIHFDSMIKHVVRR